MVHSASDYEYIREYCYFYSLDDALPFRPSLDILNAFRHEVIHVNIGHFGSYSPLFSLKSLSHERACSADLCFLHE